MKKRIIYGTVLIAACHVILAADYFYHLDSLITALLAFLAVAGYLEFASLLRAPQYFHSTPLGRLFLPPRPPRCLRLLPVLPVLLAALPLRPLLHTLRPPRRCVLLLRPRPLRERPILPRLPAAALLGLVYIPLALASLLALRAAAPGKPEFGTVLLFTTLGIIKLGDVAAYFVGNLMGKHQLAPKLSPNKTIEGFLAQLLVGTLLALVTLWAAWPVYPPLPALVFGLVVAAAGCAGDLVESKLKRICSVKDSAHLLPQFGGVLDLLDSILLGAPVAALLVVLFALLELGR